MTRCLLGRVVPLHLCFPSCTSCYLDIRRRQRRNDDRSRHERPPHNTPRCCFRKVSGPLLRERVLSQPKRLVVIQFVRLSTFLGLFYKTQVPVSAYSAWRLITLWTFSSGILFIADLQSPQREGKKGRRLLCQVNFQ